ncbi:hypothetical protein [Spiroplasma citri]
MAVLFSHPLMLTISSLYKILLQQKEF